MDEAHGDRRPSEAVARYSWMTTFFGPKGPDDWSAWVVVAGWVATLVGAAVAMATGSVLALVPGGWIVLVTTMLYRADHPPRFRGSPLLLATRKRRPAGLSPVAATIAVAVEVGVLLMALLVFSFDRARGGLLMTAVAVPAIWTVSLWVEVELRRSDPLPPRPGPRPPVVPMELTPFGREMRHDLRGRGSG